jgi:hypothetical protein
MKLSNDYENFMRKLERFTFGTATRTAPLEEPDSGMGL